MALIADGMLVLAAMAASLYCWVLSRRLRNLSQLDQGLGAAISSLSQQVEEMETALSASKAAIEERSAELKLLTRGSEQAAKRLENLIEQARRSDLHKPTSTDAGSDVLSVSRSASQATDKPEAMSNKDAKVEQPEFGSEALTTLISRTKEAADAPEKTGVDRVLRALKLEAEEDGR